MTISFAKPEHSPSLLGRIPSLDEPIEMLTACHGRVRSFVKTLCKLVPHVAVHGADRDARLAAANILRYFDTAAPKHHQDEEADLFPALRGYVEQMPELAMLIDTLESEHVLMFDLWRQLRERLIRIREGEIADLAGDRLAERFALIYQAHADKEESTVFVAAEKFLTPAEITLLAHHMTARRRSE